MASAGNDDGSTTDDRVTVLTFDLDGDRYCVRTESVASVLGVTDEDAIATADDPWNAGVVSVSGNRIRVVDLPRAFNSTARTASRIDAPKLLVFSLTDGDGDYYGWLVDDVDVTRTVRTSSVEPTRTSTHTRHVKGRFDLDGETVVWLDERAIHG
ncbi:chemotaxis protein CheW [Natronorubrum sp. JWXQ-INN-674]|uniref:Chemotaxis protein CheW n=1 Tax=Natronorubrum halalkaliphilum TaxID=2691917 RepID=A0A6B0VR69_9EURY|nr:chemotaxis protein CheW [Natronorubrum halalkaliphilum]MXV64008.1 chemotaxis protein CheW [Natronorubrum halalkaliphilum]